MGFFDSYPRFFETSRTGAVSNRLNKRHQAIFATRPEIYHGARVLDIASHDGRWSFAALKAGAAHVIGVEPREHLIQNATATLQLYGCTSDQFHFVQGDVFDFMHSSMDSFDVILCLGFFYHTYRHPELMKLIRRRAPRHLVIDSQVLKSDGLLCAVRKDVITNEFEAAADHTSYNGRTYVAMPSAGLLKDFVEHFGFRMQEVDWAGLIGGEAQGVKDYADGNRITLICDAGSSGA
jgi:ubiquinone/menaquinone biosynthesis C-methylase UbiE